MYASAEFAELADWCRALVDRLGAALPAGARARLERAFVTSSHYGLELLGDGLERRALVA